MRKLFASIFVLTFLVHNSTQAFFDAEDTNRIPPSECSKLPEQQASECSRLASMLAISGLPVGVIGAMLTKKYSRGSGIYVSSYDWSKITGVNHTKGVMLTLEEAAIIAKELHKTGFSELARSSNGQKTFGKMKGPRAGTYATFASVGVGLVITIEETYAGSIAAAIVGHGHELPKTQKAGFSAKSSRGNR